MKKLFALLALALTLGLAACSPPSEISLPDSNVKYENGVVMYKDKPYTGKVVSNLKDKIEGYEGFVTLKDGHLDGKTEVTGKNSDKFKFTVVNGQLDGDVIADVEQMKMKGHLVFAAGKLKSMKIDAPNTKQDLTVADNGNVSGKMAMNGQTIELKDGVAELGNGASMKMSIKDGKVIVEAMHNGKVLQKQENDLKMDLPSFEKQILPAMFSGA